MRLHRFRTAIWLSTMALAAVVVALPTLAARPPHGKATGKSGPKPPAKAPAPVDKAKVAALAVVDQFEQAYKNRDKETMLMKLMVPTTDLAALEKRYQWLRGYGPKDLPGTKHPPILFETTKGSFVPNSYKVTLAEPLDASHWHVRIREEGTYSDEDGRYAVSRVRHFKTTTYKGKVYVMDYYLAENPEDFGFYVDDIADRMTKL